MHTPINQVSPAKAVAEALVRGKQFLVCAHENPDGDAIGSTTAMGLVLAALGKDVVLYNPSGLPEDFAWLDMPGKVQTELPDLDGVTVVTLDCGALDRVGEDLANAADPKYIVNIDHHLGNPEFGGVNFVDTSYSSTTEMVLEVARELGMEPTGALGEAIYLGLVTDTGNFAYDNVTPRTLKNAAEIVDKGLKPGPFNANLQNQLSPQRLALSCRVLSNVKLLDEGRIGLVRISLDDMAATGTNKSDTDGFINTVRRLKSVKVAVALREDGPKDVKFSLRSTGEVNVQPAAAFFSGGGHKNASGGRILAPLDEAEEQLLAQVRPIAQAAG
jgi:phosphoesterase RecJ-like protein